MMDGRWWDPHAAVVVTALQDVANLEPGLNGQRGEVEGVDHLRTGTDGDRARRGPEVIDGGFAVLGPALVVSRAELQRP